MAVKKIVKCGRPLKKKVIESFNETPEITQEQTVESTDQEGCHVCNSPVAPGQNYVCIDHQRTN